MIIEVEKDFFNENLKPILQEDSEVLKSINRSSGLGSTTFNVNLASLSLEEIEEFYSVAKKTKNRSMMVQLAPIRNVMKDTESTKVTSLKALSMGIIEFMRRDVIDGWLYQVGDDKIPNPYLVRSIKYVSNYRDERPCVELELVANSAKGSNKNGLYDKTISFDSDNIQGKTVYEILRSRKLFKETNELKEIYNEHIQMFKTYQPQFGKQFWIEGTMYSDFNSYRDSMMTMGKSKGVNDEETIKRKFTEFADAEFWRRNGAAEKFTEIPFHCYIRMFHLGTHNQMWVHASGMIPYVYNTNLRDKLVLPQTHRDLIDILVEDMNILQEDIIEGKSGGTTILCVGKPGLGKTLSAEVYSEVIQRPLYKVHSGQLGLSASTVQKNLEDILKRASRWNAVLLLDEADVYIRSRGNDLEHNAVVASFLQTLEYFDGLLFMTTNRGDDVDDAILSRCIAVIKYETPSHDNARRIWRVLADQFEVKLSDELIKELVNKFPSVSGRDIKELLKLTSRYAKGKNIPISIEVFRQCAQFRGISITE